MFYDVMAYAKKKKICNFGVILLKLGDETRNLKRLEVVVVEQEVSVNFKGQDSNKSSMVMRMTDSADENIQKNHTKL